MHDRNQPLAIFRDGSQSSARREALGLNKSEVAIRGAKAREVVSRLKAGKDSTVLSPFAVMGALKLVLRLEPGGMPKASEVSAIFQDNGDS